MKWAIIYLKENGQSSNKSIACEISDYSGRSLGHQTVKRICISRTNSVENRWNVKGRPKLLTTEDQEVLTQSCVDGFSPINSIKIINKRKQIMSRPKKNYFENNYNT